MSSLGKEVGVNRRSLWRGVAVLLALTVGGVACGSNGERKADSKKEGSQYDLRAPAPAVAAGLGRIDTLVKQIALAVSADAKAAKEQAEGIEALWEPIEGTI